VVHRRAQDVQHRLRPVERVPLAPDDDDERAVLGLAIAAAHGRVQMVDAAGHEPVTP